MKKKIIFTIILTLFFFAFNLRAQMRVHLINVGQGNATLIEFPCAAILIDAGGETNSLYNSSDALKIYLNDFFQKRDDLNSTIQCVYLTHPHSDHTTGVPVILQQPYLIKNVVTNGLERGSGKAGQIKLHRLVEAGEATSTTNDDVGFEPVTTPMIGPNGLTDEVIDPVNCTGTDPIIKVLWGTSSTNPGWTNTAFNNGNNHSLVIKVEDGASSFLAIGDLEEKSQQSLVAKYNDNNLLDADVLLVGHHGSKNGTTNELLNKVTPQIALIGIGDPDRNIRMTAWEFGHPNKGVLDMLQNKLSSTRTSITVKAATGKKTFVPYNVTKAIYATAWDDNVVLEADALGNWHKVETTIVPDLVNINTANLSELITLPGLGASKAQAIIDYRNNHGNFTSIDQLDDVPGIGPATINLLRPYVTI